MLLAFILLAIIALVIGTNSVFANKKKLKRGWKIQREAKDMHLYAELFDGEWRSIEIKSEWYSKNVPRHAIYIKRDWSSYPDWAQERKELIIQRLQEEFKPPTFTIIETNQ
jgi:hypothetical protein